LVVNNVQHNAQKYTRFERARIVGARALQIAMGAPVLIEVEDGTMNPVELAIREYKAGVIPITVKRSIPPKQTIGKTFLKKGGK
jgi:DNA-directed RNA polymerase subunit K